MFSQLTTGKDYTIVLTKDQKILCYGNNTLGSFGISSLKYQGTTEGDDQSDQYTDVTREVLIEMNRLLEKFEEKESVVIKKILTVSGLTYFLTISGYLFTAGQSAKSGKYFKDDAIKLLEFDIVDKFDDMFMDPYSGRVYLIAHDFILSLVDGVSHHCYDFDNLDAKIIEEGIKKVVCYVGYNNKLLTTIHIFSILRLYHDSH